MSDKIQVVSEYQLVFFVAVFRVVLLHSSPLRDDPDNGFEGDWSCLRYQRGGERKDTRGPLPLDFRNSNEL